MPIAMPKVEQATPSSRARGWSLAARRNVLGDRHPPLQLSGPGTPRARCYGGPGLPSPAWVRTASVISSAGGQGKSG